MKNRTRLIYFSILIIGLVVRLGLPFVLDQNPAKGDGSIYVQHTENLKYHGVYSSQQASDPQSTFDHMPGMPFYLHAIFQVVDRESPWAILPNLLCGWGILLVLGLILKEIGVPEKARWIALGVYACLPILDYYALQFYPEVPAALLTLAGFYALIRLMKEPHLKWAVLVGGLFALAVFFRPELILNFAVAGLALLFAQMPMKKVLLYIGVMAGILIGLLTPWTFRNYQVSGNFVFLAQNHAPGTTVEGNQAPGWAEERGCAKGLYLWLNTWHTTEKHVKIAAWDFMEANLDELPVAAFTDDAEKNEIASLQQAEKYTCGMDAQLEQIAFTRIEAKPLRFGLWLPLQRTFHLLFRTERFDSIEAGKSGWMWWIYALLSNLIMGLGLLGAIFLRKRPQVLWLFVVAIGLRLSWFAWFYHVEYRYMLLYFPLFFILAVYFCYRMINRRSSPIATTA